MQFIEQWLTGLELDYIVPKLKENGVTTPKRLAGLTPKDMLELCKYPTTAVILLIRKFCFSGY